MGVKLTRYSRDKARGKKRKRTILPTRKQAMFNRHRSTHNTPICPDGQRMINGACTDASGIGFNGNDLNGNNFTPDNNNLNSNYAKLDYNEFVPLAQQLLLKHTPSWFSQRQLPKSMLIISIELAHLYSVDGNNGKQFKKWTEMIDRANQLGKSKGQSIIQVIESESEPYRRAVINSLQQESEEDTDEIMGWIIPILILVALWYIFPYVVEASNS